MIDKNELFGEFTPDLTLELAECLKRFVRHSTRPQPTDYMYQTEVAQYDRDYDRALSLLNAVEREHSGRFSKGEL